MEVYEKMQGMVQPPACLIIQLLEMTLLNIVLKFYGLI